MTSPQRQCPARAWRAALSSVILPCARVARLRALGRGVSLAGLRGAPNLAFLATQVALACNADEYERVVHREPLSLHLLTAIVLAGAVWILARAAVWAWSGR